MARLARCAKADGTRRQEPTCVHRKDTLLRKYGCAESCFGCTSAATESKAVDHSDACRHRVEEKMVNMRAEKVDCVLLAKADELGMSCNKTAATTTKKAAMAS